MAKLDILLCYTEKVAKPTGPQFLEDHSTLASGGVLGCTIINSVLKDGLSGIAAIKANLEKANQADAFKNFVDNNEWENFIASFKALPGYGINGLALNNYKDVCPHIIVSDL